MLTKLRPIWMPVSGGLAGFLAFRLSAPFEGSLANRQLSLTEITSLYTLGTQWGMVNRLAYGALLGAFFCFGLSAGRQTPLRILINTLLGLAFGAGLNYLCDSGSDLLGIAIGATLPKEAGLLGTIVASIAWFILVPLGISMAVTLAMGPTRERIRRALYATVSSAVACFIAHHIAATLAGVLVVKETFEQAVAGKAISLASFLPVWQAQAIAAGIALGLVLCSVDQRVRAASLRLVMGRNEYRDWNLDYAVNVIGAREGVAIPLFGFQGVAADHAAIVNQRGVFHLQLYGPTVLLNQQPAQPTELRNGDLIQIGQALLEFRTNAPVRAVMPVRQPIPTQAVARVLVGPKGPLLLEDRCYRVGRDPECDICLGFDGSVSRHHAEVRVTAGQTFVVDQGSRNGTRVNGQPATAPIPLREGDVVEFGLVRFVYGSQAS